MVRVGGSVSECDLDTPRWVRCSVVLDIPIIIYETDIIVKLMYGKKDFLNQYS